MFSPVSRAWDKRRTSIQRRGPKRVVEVSDEAVMNTFDNAMKKAAPGGNPTTPIAIAALLLGKLVGGGSSSASGVQEPGQLGSALGQSTLKRSF